MNTKVKSNTNSNTCSALLSSNLDNEFGVIECILQQYRDGIIPMRTKVVKQWLITCEK